MRMPRISSNVYLENGEKIWNAKSFYDMLIRAEVIV